MNSVRFRSIPLLALGVGLLLLWNSRAMAEQAPAQDIFVRVGDTVITADEYLAELRARVRQKFYHGKTPEAELRVFRREVGEDLIRRLLLAREAERRGLQPDEAAVATQLERLEQRYGRSPQWAQHKHRILSTTAERLRTDGRIEALATQVRKIAPPSEAEVRDYFRRHPDKFTTPERLGLSIMLIRVPPSGSSQQWEQAHNAIEGFQAQLTSGAAFTELAKLHSQDPSADEGGDLGFIHRDMLGESAQQAVDGLAVGAVSPPVRLLEGYALFRLNRREPAQLNSFESVRERTEALWLREAQDSAWTAFTDRLHDAANVEVDESHYLTSAER